MKHCISRLGKSTLKISRNLSMASSLSHSIDLYNGVQIPSSAITETFNAEDVEGFGTALASSIAAWKEQKRGNIWLTVPTSHSKFIAVAIDQQQMEIHHAKKEYVMLTKWLPTNRPSPIPEYCNSHLGAGGMVFNAEGQVLVIREKKGVSANMKDWWKLPGGAIDVHEDLSTGVEREIWEETGIKARFKSILAMRQMHDFRFGMGDLYFICWCTLVDETKTVVSPQEEEIAECKWMDAEDWIKMPHMNSRIGAIEHIILDISKAMKTRNQSRLEHLLQSNVPGLSDLRMPRSSRKDDVWYFADKNANYNTSKSSRI